MNWFDDQMDADAIVIGAGLAGLTATAELARAGRRVLLLDQEPESNMGGQAFWSFGGRYRRGGRRGARGDPAAQPAARGTRSSRVEVGQFELHAPAVIATSGGIGGNLDLASGARAARKVLAAAG